MRFFCCCTSSPGGSACQPCPEPIVAGTPVRHRISVGPVTIWADRAGSGALYDFSDFVCDSMKGDCFRQKYRRKALFLQDQAPLSCEGWEDWCQDGLLDEDGPEYSDPAIDAEFDGCGGLVGDVFGNNAYRWTIDEAGDVTRIVDVTTCVKYECEVGGGIRFIGSAAGPGPVLTVVQVEYTWAGDQFELEGLFDDCSVQTINCNVQPQTFTCYYAREVAPGERVALGAYKLIYISDPGPVNTHNATGGRCCTSLTPCAQSVCRPTIDAELPVGPFTWTPPLNILVTRLN